MSDAEALASMTARAEAAESDWQIGEATLAKVRKTLFRLAIGALNEYGEPPLIDVRAMLAAFGFTLENAHAAETQPPDETAGGFVPFVRNDAPDAPASQNPYGEPL